MKKATEFHIQSGNNDINFLLGVDLEILGQSRKECQKYVSKIREEYSIYSASIYNQERKKNLY